MAHAADTHEPNDRPRPSLARRIAAKAARSRGCATLRHTGFVLAFMLLIAGGMDVVSTNVALAGGFAEGNPVMGSLQTTLGSWWVLPKIALHLAAAYWLLWLPSRRMIRCARIVAAGYVLILFNNLWIAIPALSAYVQQLI